MKFRPALAIAAPLAFALAGCGHSDKASTEPQADTVEIPADEAMQNVTDQPVADPSANATVPSDTGTAETEQQKIQAAGDNAADTAAAAADAMDEGNATEAATEEQKKP